VVGWAVAPALVIAPAAPAAAIASPATAASFRVILIGSFLLQMNGVY
jgi:hypothetical protein